MNGISPTPGIIQELLGHNKLDTTAPCTRIATGMMAAIESQLDLLSQRSNFTDWTAARLAICQSAGRQSVIEGSSASIDLRHIAFQLRIAIAFSAQQILRCFMH